MASGTTHELKVDDVVQSYGPGWASDEMGGVESQPISSTVIKYKTDVLVVPGNQPTQGTDFCQQPQQLDQLCDALHD